VHYHASLPKNMTLQSRTPNKIIYPTIFAFWQKANERTDGRITHHLRLDQLVKAVLGDRGQD
jgi:hypothetical protein